MTVETSAAALAMQTPDKLRTDKESIMVALVAAPRGLTRRQLAARTGIKINTVNGRVADLLADGWAVVIGAVVEEGAKVGVVCAKKRERLF